MKKICYNDISSKLLIGDNMKKDKKNIYLFKNQILVTSIAVFALVISIIGSSYALFTSNASSDEYNVVKVGALEMSYVDNGSGYGDILSLNGAYPTADRDGLSSTPYRFYIKNTGDMAADFKIKIKNDETIIEADGCGNNLLDFDYVKVQFDSTGEVHTLGELVSSDYTLYEKKNLEVGSSEIHEIRIWLASNTPNDAIGKHFHGKLVIESTQAGIDSKYTKTYSVGDSVRLLDGSRWHVLEPSDSNTTTVVLMSDYNLNEDGSYCTTGTCSTFAFDSGNRTSDYCTDATNGCNKYAKNGSTVLDDSSIKTWLEGTYKPILESAITTNEGTLEDLTVTLPTMGQIAKADYKTFNQSVLEVTNTSFLVTSTYWTKTEYNNNSSSVWYMKQDNNKNDLIYANNSTTVGIRPVITVSKLDVVTE